MLTPVCETCTETDVSTADPAVVLPASGEDEDEDAFWAVPCVPPLADWAW